MYSHSPYCFCVDQFGGWSWEPAIISAVRVIKVSQCFRANNAIKAVRDTIEKSENDEFIASLNNASGDSSLTSVGSHRPAKPVPVSREIRAMANV